MEVLIFFRLVCVESGYFFMFFYVFFTNFAQEICAQLARMDPFVHVGRLTLILSFTHYGNAKAAQYLYLFSFQLCVRKTFLSDLVEYEIIISAAVANYGDKSVLARAYLKTL